MKKFRVKEYNVYSSKVDVGEGVKFAVLTDLHGMEFGKQNEDLVKKIKEIDPDAVLAVGDLNVRSAPETLKTAEELLLNLVKDYPVYYSLGNHEYKLLVSEKYREQRDAYLEYEKTLGNAGIHFLHNGHETMQIGQTKIFFHGLELPLSYYQKVKTPKLSLSEIEKFIGKREEEGFHVLMAHNPKYGKIYFSWGADLILAGHYHGGIMRLGEHWGILSPQFHVFPSYCCGDFVKNGQHMIVSAGLGEHTIPVRIHNPRELLVVAVKPLEKSRSSM